MPFEWRDHPQLQDRLHPQHPDDVQVIVHDGGPRLSDRLPEVVWVRIVANQADVFTAEILNQPEQLVSVRQGDRIQFVVPATGEYPLMVRPKYLQERSAWVIHPCNKCGLSELFDAPSELIAKVFPNLSPGESPEMFTAFCGLCRGVQGVERADTDRADTDRADTDRPEPASPEPPLMSQPGKFQSANPQRGRYQPAGPPRKWWQFWR